MENDSIDRIRTATFTVARRGYDKREVDDYLTKLADWLEGGGADQAARDTVRRELERIGQKTAKIITSAEDAADSIRDDAEDASQERLEDARRQSDSVRAAAEKYSSQTRDEADAYDNKIRGKADAYAEENRTEVDTYSANTRNEADLYAARKREEAEAKAKSVIDQGNKRRGEIETVISDLERRRDAVLAGLKKLSTELAGTATQHHPDAGAPSDRESRQAATQKPRPPMRRAAAPSSEGD